MSGPMPWISFLIFQDLGLEPLERSADQQRVMDGAANLDPALGRQAAREP
jgi:hypothetical protein